MKKLRIGYFADGPWSHLAFEKINQDPRLEIAFIVPRADTKDNTLKAYAGKFSIDYFKCENVNSVDSLKKIDSYNCDILVSMSFNQIFKEGIINLTQNKIINCHAGKLPFYRGRNILNWVLINDESEFGITVHYVDKGIDTGDIILQRTFPISENDNYSSLLNVAFTECANILYDSLVLFVDNKVNPVVQNTIHYLGMYCGRRVEGDEIIDWNDTSRNVFNFIRSISTPGPQAHALVSGKTVKINKAKYFKDAPQYIGKPGQILSKTSGGYLVKTKDSFIEILEVNSKLRIGQKFENKQQ
jgi:methionyl-tRNA formyltransferase